MRGLLGKMAGEGREKGHSRGGYIQKVRTNLFSAVCHKQTIESYIYILNGII